MPTNFKDMLQNKATEKPANKQDSATKVDQTRLEKAVDHVLKDMKSSAEAAQTKAAEDKQKPDPKQH
jgi:hypothetical protein